MRLVRPWIPAALAAAAALAGAPLLAQNIADSSSYFQASVAVPGTWELTAVGGGYFGRQIYQSGYTAVDASTTYEYGARLGYNLLEGVGIEASWTHAEPDLEATPLSTGGISGPIGTLTSDVYELDGLFSLGNEVASFYVVLGLGATTLSPELPGISTSSSTRLSGSAGIGGKVWLARHFGLRAEGRWRWVSTGHTSDAGIWCDPFGICYGYSTNVYGYPDLVGGVTLRF